jgi:hypothetical protein
MASYIIKNGELFLHNTPYGLGFTPLKENCIVYDKFQGELTVMTLQKAGIQAYLVKIEEKKVKKKKGFFVNWRTARAQKRIEKQLNNKETNE